MRRAPALPPHAPSGKGPVLIVVERDPKDDDGTVCAGYYDAYKRDIHVEQSLCLVDQWAVLLHEATHMALTDADVSLTSDQEERVCTTVANWLVQQALDPKALLTFRRSRA